MFNIRTFKLAIYFYSALQQTQRFKNEKKQRINLRECLFYSSVELEFKNINSASVSTTISLWRPAAEHSSVFFCKSCTSLFVSHIVVVCKCLNFRLHLRKKFFFCNSADSRVLIFHCNNF